LWRGFAMFPKLTSNSWAQATILFSLQIYGTIGVYYYS
jgi:hypothetical protein